MARKTRSNKSRARAEPQKRSGAFLCTDTAYQMLCGGEYTNLANNPEIMAGVNKICDIISSMTIHLMANTEKGDIRIKNELAKKIDVNPNQYMTKKTFLAGIVRQLLLEGDGNCVVLPTTEQGYLGDLIPLPPSAVAFVPDGYGYQILANGTTLKPDTVLHFVINPDVNYAWKGTGYRVALREVANTLLQASKTKQGFMESKWLPPIIVKVDGLTDEFSSKEGRRSLLGQYIESSEAGEPWMIPADQFSVETVKPLSLRDIALPESVKLDKRTVAAILDIPPYLLGEGEFNGEEWNNFVNTRIKALCNAIEQELTRKLLISPDLYFRFNIRSIYSFDIKTLSTVGANMYTRGIMSGNEVRDWINLTPREGLDELQILENFIPLGMIGEQNKLMGGDD